MELRKAIYEFVVATLPLVVVYYVGWAYLYFYLNSFGINISELHFDTTTIFIYAFAPISIVLRAHWLIILLVIVGIVVLLAVIARFVPGGWSSLKHSLRWLRGKFGSLPIEIQTLLLIAGLICFLLLLAPILKSSAQRRRDEVWAGRAEYVIPLVRGEF